ncbi:methyltransferase [Antrihabitans cavernicola]|uniref:Methyltransferase n=1 Tax=Antrihabitans cavernicola TaxID=2495913 RepID=A0A5A7SHT0_9NOCA|nr:methyltransferase [Spelaeibacter cavernicola]KAA0024163.1 methyltransferase [Spelaeibacter cavernicola]
MSTENLTDLMTPMAVRVAATLRIADHIEAGEDQCDRLAAITHSDPSTLARLMRFLVVRSVFDEPEPGRYALNAYSRRLRTGEQMQAWLDLEGAGARIELSYTDLLHTVRTGTAAWEHFYGKPMWEDFAERPAQDESFNRLMELHCQWLAPSLIEAYDWSNVGHIVDVGGGNGALLAEILGAQPHLKGTVFDQPHLEAQASNLIQQSGLDGRCSFAGGSFFDAVPAADVYVLANVLHNWPDAEATKILSRCVDAAPDAPILNVEWAITDGNPLRETEMDLRNLVLMNGKERTVGELEDIGHEAGVAVRKVVKLKSGLSMVIMGSA